MIRVAVSQRITKKLTIEFMMIIDITIQPMLYLITASSTKSVKQGMRIEIMITQVSLKNSRRFCPLMMKGLENPM